MIETDDLRRVHNLPPLHPEPHDEPWPPAGDSWVREAVCNCVLPRKVVLAIGLLWAAFAVIGWL